MSIKQYDPAKVAIILGGHIVTGFADGSFVTVTRTNDQWNHKSGSDGEEMRSKTNDFRGEMTLTLMQSSSSNTFIQALKTADDISGDGGVPLLVKDNSSDGTLASSEYVWVKKDPDLVRGREDNNTEWTFSCKRLTIVHSGHSES